MSATIRENVLRVLEHHGLADSLAITREDEDRLWAWPVNDNLLRHVVLNEWFEDIRQIAAAYHGGRLSFRERGVRPALQLVVHLHQAEGSPWPYFLELDLDQGAPSGVVGFFRHAWEVARNALTGGKTDQQSIREMLDRRFQDA